MAALAGVEIRMTSIEDDAFPMCLRFEFTNRHGKHHDFMEKSSDVLSGRIPDLFPAVAHFSTSVVRGDEDYIVACTDEPHGVSSVDG